MNLAHIPLKFWFPHHLHETRGCVLVVQLDVEFAAYAEFFDLAFVCFAKPVFCAVGENAGYAGGDGVEAVEGEEVEGEVGLCGWVG